ncbi:MAG: hypothetical protein LUE11_12940 [Clostridia bacterium]|nr:hypothetical protein [Clostridia bacterium]
MTVTELMTAAGVTPKADYTGEVKTNFMILGVAVDDTETDPKEYVVAAAHITNLGAEVDASTEDSNYLYEGKFTARIDARRTFSLEGKRIVGDAFQDWACSHAVKFGTGNAVIRDYIYFNALTGKGEKGRLTINTTKDGSGEANNSADFACDAYSSGAPDEYTYSATA